MDTRKDYNAHYRKTHREHIREYNRKWRKEHKTKIKTYRQTFYAKHGNKSAYVQINRTRLKTYRADYLKTHPCSVCGESDSIVLEFHHRNPSTKKYEIGDMIRNASYCVANLTKEITKCDVLCANCHRRKHKFDGHTRTKKVPNLGTRLAHSGAI